MSMLLVAIQFVLILLLLFPWPAALLSSHVAMAALAAGVVLGLWTLYFNRIGNFNIRPEPKTGGRLVTNGPYRFIRHPMYTAALLLMAPFVFTSDDAIKIFYWVLLLAVLRVKSSLEEKLLTRQFSEYVGHHP